MVLEQFIIDADIIWDQVGKTFFENPEAKPGRIMRVQVVNAGIIEDLTGYTLNLGWTSVRDPSKFGLDAFDDVDITKGIFEIEYTSGMLTNVGPLNATLQLVPPGEGRPIESNNFKLTVKNSAINPEAIQGETSFSTLENALVEVNGWNARIDVVEQEFKDRADALDGAYPVRLTAAEQSVAAVEAQVDLLNRGLGETMPTMASLLSTYPTGDTRDHIVAGNIAEVDTFTVTAIPTAAGNITITLNGVAKTVAVDPAVQSTTALVATAIRAAVYAGWTTGGTGSVVTFTATTVGTRTAPALSGETTGTTGTFVRTAIGEVANFHRYFWNGSAWTDGGAYQATEANLYDFQKNFMKAGSVSAIFTNVVVLGFKKTEYLLVSDIRNGYLGGYGFVLFNCSATGVTNPATDTIYTVIDGVKPVGIKTYKYDNGAGKAIQFDLNWDIVDAYIAPGSRITSTDQFGVISPLRYSDVPKNSISRTQLNMAEVLSDVRSDKATYDKFRAASFDVESPTNASAIFSNIMLYNVPYSKRYSITDIRHAYGAGFSWNFIVYEVGDASTGALASPYVTAFAYSRTSQAELTGKEDIILRNGIAELHLTVNWDALVSIIPYGGRLQTTSLMNQIALSAYKGMAPTNGSITTDKYADGSITAAKLAPGAGGGASNSFSNPVAGGVSDFITDVLVEGLPSTSFVLVSDIRTNYSGYPSSPWGFSVYLAENENGLLPVGFSSLFNTYALTKPDVETVSWTNGDISFYATVDWVGLEAAIGNGLRFAGQDRYHVLSSSCFAPKRISSGNGFTYLNSLKTDKPILCLVDDDNNAAFMTKVKPAFDAVGAKCTVAVNPLNVGGGGMLSLADLQALKAAGHEIVSHTWSHPSSVFKESITDLTTVTDEAMSTEFKLAYDYMVTNGFNEKIIVYPWGGWSGFQARRIKMLAAKYHQFGVNSGGGVMNGKVLDNMYYSRSFILDASGLGYYTAQIDSIIANKGWLILGTHSYEAGLTSGFIQQILQYALDHGVEIMTVGAANEIKRNVVSIGNYGDKSGSFFIGRDGTTVYNG